MIDKIEGIGEYSLIQHGKYNDRIYLMKFDVRDFPTIIDQLEILASNNDYSKVFVKVPTWTASAFQKNDYAIEAFIPDFFYGKIDAIFMSKFLKPWRENPDLEKLDDFNLFMQECSRLEAKKIEQTEGIKLHQLKAEDAPEAAKIYSTVFNNYPFPIEDPNYIVDTMKEHVQYYGIREGENMVAVSSAETYETIGNVEMTDFAVLPEKRGRGYALTLLHHMEIQLKQKGFKTAYTIARMNSLSMNKTFLNLGYKYSGTLVNNTRIGEGIESMNVLYKSLQ